MYIWCYIFLFYFIEIFYFRIAGYYNIVDRPNNRSSHNSITIRGAGVLFPLAIFPHVAFNGLTYPFFLSGLFLISLISFCDDLRPVSSKIRLIGHLIAVSLVFLEIDILSYSPRIIAISYILVIGSINAYNFMDGINGITGSYSLVAMCSLYFINEKIISFTHSEWLIVFIIALFVFNIFNFRTIAKCFAGDVGSISIAFIIIFFLLQLIFKTAKIEYIGLLLVYGLDSVTTIMFRLIRGERIFNAHRSHFYQYLVNVKGWRHLRVSGLYMLVQLLINIVIIYSDMNGLQFLLFVVVSGIVFAGIRFKVEGKRYLMDNE